MFTESQVVLSLSRKIAKSFYNTDDDLAVALEVIKKRYKITSNAQALVVLNYEKMSELMKYNHSKATEVDEAMNQMRELRNR